MKKTVSTDENDIPIRELYPHLDETQLKQAEENLKRYLAVAIRIYERLLDESQASANPKTLTVSSAQPTMEVKRSQHNLPSQA